MGPGAAETWLHCPHGKRTQKGERKRKEREGKKGKRKRKERKKLKRKRKGKKKEKLSIGCGSRGEDSLEKWVGRLGRRFRK